MNIFPEQRLRRLRYHPTLREMLVSVRLSVKDLIAPLFVREGSSCAKEIPSMPGQFQFSPDLAMETVDRWADKGIPAVLLFGITEPAEKDEIGSTAWDDRAPVQKVVGMIREKHPELVIIADTCLCEYTSHGHCGPICSETGHVHNDEALQCLAKAAVSQARAGAHIIAPSAMMDGQVFAIREALDAEGFNNTAILSYAVKYASSMYGPFRDAAESPPQFGDRKTYQMDYRSTFQANLEADSDVAEGADMLMVKPAVTYLDVISEVRRRTSLPLAAYHVSGEFSQIKAAAAAGWIDEKNAAIEVTTAIRRAGADLIITYFAEQLAEWLDS